MKPQEIVYNYLKVDFFQAKYFWQRGFTCNSMQSSLIVVVDDVIINIIIVIMTIIIIIIIIIIFFGYLI